MIKKWNLYILKEKYLQPKILGHTKNVKTSLDKQGERCLPPTLPQEAERGSSPLTAGVRQETGRRGIQEAGNPAWERREGRRNPQADGRLGRGDGGGVGRGGWGRGDPSMLAAEGNTSSLEMPESSGRGFSHDDEMDNKLDVNQDTKKASDNWQRS